MSEQWKDVVGYEGLYQVSDQGRVKGVWRRGSSGQELSQSTSRGYKTVGLFRKPHRKCAKVHRLVLEAFVGQGDGLDCCHINHDRADNRLENLMWATRQENMM